MVLEIWDPQSYDGLRRQLIPSFDLLYESAAEAVRMTVPEEGRILDLAAGTGLLSAAVRNALPKAELVLTDGSERMLEMARSRFSGDESTTYEVADLTSDIPSPPFDGIVSGLAIHHLPHEAKRDLFRRIHDALEEGGVFVNVEQIRGPDAAAEAMYDRRHEDHVHRSQTPPEEWAAGRERMRYDICADLESQLTWLREAGFAVVDCLAKDWRFACYAAWRR